MAVIDDILKQMLTVGGSDLHMTVGLPPKIRASGTLKPLEGYGTLTGEDMEVMLSEICPPAKWTEFLKKKDLDLAYEIPGVARFRGNYLYNHWGQAAVFRQIPAKIVPFDKLGLPEALKKFCYLNEGLVVVTGPTGSGKSTTLAAMIDFINTNQKKTIITIEDPIEFVHTNKLSTLIHREVGDNTGSFATALRSAMRHDPDIILLGEMRELETIKLALSCASMGMLVFGTLHTNNAPKTVDRIINAFPAEQQNQIRILLSTALAGVVAQLLCKKKGGGRVAVHEILLQHEALPNSIRTGQIGNLKTIIESSSADGMCSMDNTLLARYREGIIDINEAYGKANNKALFEVDYKAAGGKTDH